MVTTNYEAQISRALHLLVDSAIVVEMALCQKDLDESDSAIRAFKQNADTTLNLLLAWRSEK